jgi:hypothetical protein
MNAGKGTGMTFEGGSGDRSPGRGFAIGTVIRRSVAITYHNLFRFPAIILAIALPVLLLTVVARMLLATNVRNTGTGSAIDFSNGGSAILFLAIAGVLAMLSYLMIQAAIVVGALLTLGGRTAAIGTCLSRALAALPRLFLAGLLLFVGGGIVAGIVGFLVVQLFGGIGPDGKVAGDAATAFAVSSLVIMAIAIAVLTLVWVFVPVIVVERLGPVASFQRSLALTKGRRRPILGIVLIISFANVLVSWLTRMLMENGAPWGGAALNVLAALFFMALAAVLSAVGYLDLRAEKEGATADGVVRALD